MSLQEMRNYIISSVSPRTVQTHRRILNNVRSGRAIIVAADVYLRSQGVSVPGMSAVDLAQAACNDLRRIGVIIMAEPDRYK